MSCQDGELGLMTAPNTKNKKWKRMARDISKIAMENPNKGSNNLTGKRELLSEEIQSSVVKRVKSSVMSGEDRVNITAVVPMQARQAQ